MQQHSGEHIVSGMLCAAFSCDNVGFHMGADTVIIDYNAPMTWEQVLEVEDRANRYIWENHLFRAYYPTPEELTVLPYRSKKAIEGPVRITEFPGADRCACCGTHVAASGQVGLVKFLSCQKLRDGVRLELLCGGRAMEYLSRCWGQSRRIGQALSVKPQAAFPAVQRLEEQLRQMEPAATENKELRQLLGLRQQRSDLVFEAARVTQRDVSNWASTLVLDRGSQHGVAIGDCAVDSAGNLVGVVTDVGLNWCRLSTVLDTDSQFGARVFRTGETAVAGGDLALMAEGRLRLQYLSDSANLIKGDVIVTSGLGGYYPAGLVIGTVESVQTDDGGLARYAVLSPKCDVATIQEMFIITDFDVIQ